MRSRLGATRRLDDAREFTARLRGQPDHLAGSVVADHRRWEALVIGRKYHEVADADRIVVRLPASVAEPCLLAVGLDEEEVHRQIANRRPVRLAGREPEHHLVVANLGRSDDAVLALVVQLNGRCGLAAAPVVAELERVDGATAEVGWVFAVPRFAFGIRAAFLLARFAVGVEVGEGERRGAAVGVEVDDGVAARQGMALVVGIAVDRDLRRGCRRRLRQREHRHDEGDERPEEIAQLLHDVAPP